MIFECIIVRNSIYSLRKKFIQFIQIAVIQMGSMFELNKVFLKVYTAFLEKCSDVDAVCITVYKKSLYSFYTASDLFSPFFMMSNLCTINCPIYDQNR